MKPAKAQSSLRAEQELNLDPANLNSQAATCLFAQGLFGRDIGKLKGVVEFGDLSSWSWPTPILLGQCGYVTLSLGEQKTRWFLISFQPPQV